MSRINGGVSYICRKAVPLFSNKSQHTPPRGPRLDAPVTLHHVILRGIEQRGIVRDDTDRKAFLDRMGLQAKASGTGIYAFALMTNHAHILRKSGPDGISTFMRRLLTGYAKYFNWRHLGVTTNAVSYMLRG